MFEKRLLHRVSLKLSDNSAILGCNLSLGLGRSAYVCRNNECINKAIKSKAFNRSFKQNISDEILYNLMQYQK